MRIFITTTLIFISSFQLYSQDFSTRIIASSQQKSDTIIIGFDSLATTLIDNVFNESDINGVRFDSILDLRCGQISIDALDCELNNLDWVPEIVTQISKVDIVPRDCNGWDPSQTTNGLAPFSTLFVRNENLPIVLKWNSADFSSTCLEGSIITDWHPGGWFDAGCPKLTVPPQKLSQLDSLQLTEPSGITIIDTFGDSISLYFIAVGSQDFLDSTSDIENNDYKIYPNPTSGELNIDKSNLHIDWIEVINSNGFKIATFHKQEKININHLENGIYYLRFVSNNELTVQKIMKYGQ
jgi:hypothetical protein